MIGGGSSQFRGAEQPFGESPDPRYFYNSAMHSQALVGLLESFESGARLQILVASPGLGKTTLLRALLDRLGDRVDSAFVFNTQASAADLLGLIIQDLGVEDPRPALADRQLAFHSFLQSRGESGKDILIVIDEAQNLDASGLALIDDLLANAPRFLRFILSGQASLARSFNTVASARLRSEVESFHELLPLDRDEAINYIGHRLSVSGHSGPPLFTRDALEMIAAASSGVPRNINTLCFHALHHGPVSEHVPIDSPVIAQVLERCAFLMAAPEHVAETVASPLPAIGHPSVAPRRQASPLAGLLHQWLSSRAGVWTGTAWELKQQLQRAHSNDSDVSKFLSDVDLERLVQQEESSLIRAGIEAEVRNRKSGPRYLSIRLLEHSPAEQQKTG